MTYEEIGKAVGKLVDEKNEAYGSSFSKSGQVMRILYPQGIPLDKYDDALAVIRILDKLFRIATDRDALGESPYRDIAGYALLGTARSAKAFEERSDNCVKCGDGPVSVNAEGWCRKCFAGDTAPRVAGAKTNTSRAFDPVPRIYARCEQCGKLDVQVNANGICIDCFPEGSP